MNLNRWIVASAVGLLAASAPALRSASAAVLASEDFESYSLGNLSGQAAGGSGWSGGWTISNETDKENDIANTTPLSAGTNQYLYAGGKNKGLYSFRLFNYTAAGPFTAYTSNNQALNQGTVWTSMLLRSQRATGSQASYTDWIGFKNGGFSNAAGVSSAFMLAPAKSGGVWSVMTIDGSGSITYHSTTVPVVVGQTENTVFQFDFDTNTASVYFNPTSAAATPDFSYTFTNANGLQLTSVWTQYKFPDVDNIVAGDSFADVAIPEPASLSLLGLGALILLRRRK